MQRIDGFLAEEEVPEWASSLSTVGTECEGDRSDIGFDNATFEWHGVPKESVTESRFQLGPLDLKFPKSKLSLISGATGAGKSALLSALLGGQCILGGDSSPLNCVYFRDALFVRWCIHKQEEASGGLLRPKSLQVTST
jgi:hypothetical protein